VHTQRLEVDASLYQGYGKPGKVSPITTHYINAPSAMFTKLEEKFPLHKCRHVPFQLSPGEGFVHPWKVANAFGRILLNLYKCLKWKILCM
jgi:hypothetical protein